MDKRMDATLAEAEFWADLKDRRPKGRGVRTINSAKIMLVRELRDAYRDRTVIFVEKSSTGYCDEPLAEEELIAIEVDDFMVVNPFVSQCGRFEVNPVDTYGIAVWDAHRMAVANGLRGEL